MAVKAVIRISLDPRYIDYFHLFEEGKYFEAHEVLEGLWRETKDETREFYHGLIQLAAALVHFQKGNLKGAKELFRTASSYLKPYRPRYEGVEISKVLRDFGKFLDVWSEDPDDPSIAKKLLPRVTLEKKP